MSRYAIRIACLIRRTSVGIAASLMILLGGADMASAQGGRVGTVAPALTIDDLDGNPVTLDARAAGRPILLEFWATWCEVCEALMPTVRQAAERYSERVDFIGINVTVNDSHRRVVRFVEREKPPYRVMYDRTGRAVRTFRAPTTSYVVIIDSTGVIRYTGSGANQDLLGELAKVFTK